MAFTFIRLTTDPPSVVVTTPCADLPCGAQGSVHLVPEIESDAAARFDLTYEITEGDAAFCDAGARTFRRQNVAAKEAAVDVRFCRGPTMSPGFDSITLRVSVAERSGEAQVRETIVTVEPIGGPA